MEGFSALRSTPNLLPFPAPAVRLLRSPISIDSRNPNLKRCCSISLFNRSPRPSPGSAKRMTSISRGYCSSFSDSSGTSSPIAPLQLESPVGQFLSQLLHNHPHLLPAAVEQQLEQLHSDREAEEAKDDPSLAASGSDLVLYRRIAEVKVNERRMALEEILYALVVQRFVDADVSLVPPLPQISNARCWDEEKLEHLHSPEVHEMVRNHLGFVLGSRIEEDSSSVAEISKLRVGQIYAASIMYGYFLKRVDQRFQLEKSMTWGPEYEESIMNYALPVDRIPSASPARSSSHILQASPMRSHPSFSVDEPGDRAADLSRLRSYVLSFDSEMLRRYAMVRSKEAVSVIEKHTEALFGKQEIVITPQGTIDTSKDELLKMSLGGLRRLILEALAFGSFLWDVESYVDSRYHFVVGQSYLDSLDTSIE